MTAIAYETLARDHESAEEILNDRPSRAEAEEAVRTLIKWAGDDPTREGLLDTPKRVAKAYEDWFRGYDEDPEDILRSVDNGLYAVSFDGVKVYIMIIMIIF